MSSSDVIQYTVNIRKIMYSAFSVSTISGIFQRLMRQNDMIDMTSVIIVEINVKSKGKWLTKRTTKII